LSSYRINNIEENQNGRNMDIDLSED